MLAIPDESKGRREPRVFFWAVFSVTPPTVEVATDSRPSPSDGCGRRRHPVALWTKSGGADGNSPSTSKPLYDA
jgi:hypothetical protein